MSDDLDIELRGLRDELREDIPLPDLTRIAGRARQRRTVRRTQIGAIAAVVLVSVAVPVLRAMPTDVQPAARPPAGRSLPYTVDFADAKHGYALKKECTPGTDQLTTRCSFALLATDDGGRSWQPRKLPAGTGQFSEGWLEVYGPDQLLFGRGVMDGLERAVSNDGGRTWQSAAPDMATVVESPGAIRPGSTLVSMCIGPAAENGCELGLGSPTLDAKQVVPVLTQPPLVRPRPGTEATAGGRFWAVGQDPATGRWAISVTSDAGATWATTPFDLPGDPGFDSAWTVVEHGGVMYMTVEGTLPAGGTGLLAVFRSTDDGVSWTRTWHAERIDQLWAIQGSTIATADGRLVLNSMTEGTFQSTDGGQTFTVAKQQLPPWRIQWTRGGYLAIGPNNQFEISRDGLDWLAFRLP
jgi:photosystem II stability/assembly factor-like uncharacterized protein